MTGSPGIVVIDRPGHISFTTDAAAMLLPAVAAPEWPEFSAVQRAWRASHPAPG
jgi:hypothetical protein